MKINERWVDFNIYDKNDDDIITTVITDRRFTPVINEKQMQALKANNVKLLSGHLNGFVIEGKVKDILTVCRECCVCSPKQIYEQLNEDTVKQNGKWVNKGKEGTHGTFRTKKAADAQRKAMYANGFSEDLNELLVIGRPYKECRGCGIHYTGKDYPAYPYKGRICQDCWNRLSADSQEEIKQAYPEEFNESINERLDERQRRQYREEIGRISFNQAIIQDNGIFNIYNVKESDVDMLIRRLEELDYVEYVHKTASRYDFNTIVMPGQLPKRYFTVSGKVSTD